MLIFRDKIKRLFKKSLTFIKFIYSPLCLACILFYGWMNQDLITEIIDLSSGIYLLAAVILWALLHLISPISPKIVFKGLKSPLRYHYLLAIHINQIPARYLPGGVWHTVGRMAAYHRHGVSKTKVGLYVLIETVCPCILPLFLGSAILWSIGSTTAHSYSIGIITIVLLGIIISPPFMIKRFWPVYAHKNNLSAYLLFLALSCFFWVTATASFLMYYHAFFIFHPKAGLMPQLHIIGSYLFSWGIGYIAIFAPQGIGVFEVVAGTLIEFPMQLGSTVVFLAGFRLVALVADLFTWSLFRFFTQFYSPKSRRMDKNLINTTQTRGKLS